MGEGRTELPGRLALAIGPVGPPARWAATSNVEVGQMTYPDDRERVGRERREGSYSGQGRKEEEREGGSAVAYPEGGLEGFKPPH